MNSMRSQRRGWCLQCKRYDGHEGSVSEDRMAGWLKAVTRWRQSEKVQSQVEEFEEQFGAWLDRAATVRGVVGEPCSHFHTGFFALRW